MIIKGTRQLGSFKRGVNLYLPKREILNPISANVNQIRVFFSGSVFPSVVLTKGLVSESAWTDYNAQYNATTTLWYANYEYYGNPPGWWFEHITDISYGIIVVSVVHTEDSQNIPNGNSWSPVQSFPETPAQSQRFSKLRIFPI